MKASQSLANTKMPCSNLSNLVSVKYLPFCLWSLDRIAYTLILALDTRSPLASFVAKCHGLQSIHARAFIHHSLNLALEPSYSPGSEKISILAVLWPHLRDYSFNGLSQFFSFLLILSDHFRLQTVRRFSTRTHLSHVLHTFTNTYLPHGKPYSIKT